MGPVVEWARRWLGITQIVAENRRLTAEVRNLRIEVKQLQRNLAAAEKVAQRSTFSPDGDAIARLFSILRRGTR